MPDPVSSKKALNTAADVPHTHGTDNAETNSYHPGRGDEHDEIDVRSFLVPPQGEGELGRLGQYRVLKELGRGGMGMVLYAEDSHLRRMAALKIMLPKFARDAHARDRFLREARAAAKLQHDNVVTIYQVGEENKIPFIAMEFLKGVPLDQYLKEKGELEISQTIRIAREIAEGLQAAHEVGLIHRDIKPANIWLEAPKGRVKILDFGLAREANDDIHLTKSGAVVGTPAYMAPEQARGEAVDARSDLWSLGVVLYRLCTGKQPFSGPNTMAVLMAIGTEKPIPVRKLNPKVPVELEGLIHLLLSKDAAKRPPSAQDVVDALSDIEKPIAGAPQVVKEVVYVTLPTEVDNSPFEGIDDSDYQNPQQKIKTPASPERKRRESSLSKTPVAHAPSSPKKLYLAVGAIAFLTLAIGGFFAFRGSPKERPKVAESQNKETPKLVKAKEVVKTSEEMSPDRRAAELLLPHVASLTLQSADGKQHLVRSGNPLPTQPFSLVVIDAGGWRSGPVVPKEVIRTGLFPSEGPLQSLTAIKENGSGRLNLSTDDIVQLCDSSAAETLTTLQAVFQLNGATISALKKLPKLTSLRCFANTADNEVLARLKELPGLTDLQMINIGASTSRVGESGFAAIATLPLKRINLGSCQVSDLAAFRHVTRMPDLEFINVSDTNKFGDSALAEFTQCAKLRHLVIRNTAVTAEAVKRFRAALPNCKVEWDGDAEAQIANPDRKAAELLHPHIDGLWVRFADGRRLQIKKSDAVPEEAFVVDAIDVSQGNSALPPNFNNEILLPAVLPLRLIRRLSLSMYAASPFTDEEFERLASAPFCDQLETLSASFELSAASIDSLKKISRLKNLGCQARKIADADLVRLVELPELKILFLLGLGTSGQVSVKGYRSLAAMPLSKIHLIGPRRIELESIQTLATMQALINFGFSITARDELLPEIAKFACLKDLNLNGNRELTDTGLSHLAGCKALRNLDLSDSTGVTMEGIAKLSATLPRCQIKSNFGKTGPKIPAPALLKAPFTQEQAEKARAEWAKYEEIPERKQLELPKGVKLDLVLIPPGQFRMGTEGNTTNEVPHDVTITKPFYMAVTETTQEQYEAVMGKNPSNFAAKGNHKERLEPGAETIKFPVDKVNWLEAQAFCKSIGSQLPSEAQWEYACRAGTNADFHFGNSLNGDKANCNGKVPFGMNEKGPNLERTTKVASYGANSFGLHDMHGNVREWCRDWYAEKTDDLGEKDPERTIKISEDLRVLRGGCWFVTPLYCRSAARNAGAAGKCEDVNGFRVIVQP